MNRSWWGKFLLLSFFVVTSVIYVYPTIANLDLEKTKFPFKQKINLGLDLQGGLYMVLGVDFNRVYKDIVDRQATSLQDGLKDKGIAVTSVKATREGAPADDPRVIVEFPATSRDALHKTLKADYWTLRLVDEKPGRFELGLSREFRGEVRERTINQSIEVIRNRIDEFGVAEPVIASQGTDRVVVELPGVKEIDRAKDLIGRTAKLEFKIVADKVMPPNEVAALVEKIEKDNNLAYKEGSKFSEYVARINELAKGKIAEGTEIAFERVKSVAEGGEGQGGRIPYLLYSKTEVTGDDLQDANVSFDDETRRPNVAFSLNPRGASLFAKLTGAHVNDRLAIVLDNIVHSAPVIQQEIGGGHGRITLGRGDGDQLMKEAKDLAIVLRAGALPAQLEFLEQRVVGPSLGQDSVQKGMQAGLIGCLAIFVFMVLYYRWSGAVAVFSLVLNGLFCLAILIGLEATLTLPGMAGLALTIGMAVDSNVIIFERIRDELNEGKSVQGAIEAGFQKAFSAIFDANITHGIVAVILMTYGTGPIRGFAVTLLVGILTTLFCAVTVCKLVFDGYLARHGGDLKRLSI
jgi:protein-export membrane protein SecD